MVIRPTVGRVVLFYKYNATAQPRHFGPLAALVAKVHSDTMVNLMVVGDSGTPFAETLVRLVQANEEVPEANYCCWMPYQLGQAAKTEAAEKELLARKGHP